MFFRSNRALWHEIEDLKEAQMATQADVDALTAQIGTVSTDLAKAQTDIQAEIDALSQANPALNLDALTAAVAQLDPAVQALDQVKPTPAA
jgi:prefoldin subunit 5